MDTLSFKLSPELNTKLEYFAKLDERPKSYLIRKAIEDFIAEMEEDEADFQAGMKVLNDPNQGPNIPWEEVERELGLDC